MTAVGWATANCIFSSVTLGMPKVVELRAALPFLSLNENQCYTKFEVIFDLKNRFPVTFKEIFSEN